MKKKLIHKNKPNYLNYLIKQQKLGFKVGEQIALIRSRMIKADVHPKFIPSNKFGVLATEY
jgi:hypothetical protein